MSSPRPQPPYTLTRPHPRTLHSFISTSRQLAPLHHAPPGRHPPGELILTLDTNPKFNSNPNPNLNPNQGSAGGLQILQEGEWRDVPLTPGALVLNIGGGLERWTNNELVATMHRVRMVDTTRISIPFFLEAAHGSPIDCMPATVTSSRPCAYKPTSERAARPNAQNAACATVGRTPHPTSAREARQVAREDRACRLPLRLRLRPVVLLAAASSMLAAAIAHCLAHGGLLTFTRASSSRAPLTHSIGSLRPLHPRHLPELCGVCGSMTLSTRTMRGLYAGR